MDVTMDVIVDLLPLYMADEASPATRSLVEQYLKENPELAARVRSASEARLGEPPVEAPSPDLELASLRRTMGMLTWQRRLFAIASCLSVMLLSGAGTRVDGHMQYRFLFQDYPGQMAIVAQLAVWSWVGYLVLRRRLRWR